jgi:hypothetical protein
MISAVSLFTRTLIMDARVKPAHDGAGQRICSRLTLKNSSKPIC